MQISTANIFRMMTGRENITIAIKYEVARGLELPYLHLAIAHSKGQGQRHSDFHCEYLECGDRCGIYHYCK